LPGSHPDGGPWPSGQTTVRQDFLRFLRRNISCIRTSSGRDSSIVRTNTRPLQVISITVFAHPDHEAGVSGRLNFNTQFPYLMRVRPDQEEETSGRLIDLSFLETCKESVNRSRTNRHPDVLLKRPDGASWHRSFSIRCRCPDGRSMSPEQMMFVCLMSGQKDMSSGRMEQ
jgi:hypothetical protein